MNSDLKSSLKKCWRYLLQLSFLAAFSLGGINVWAQQSPNGGPPPKDLNIATLKNGAYVIYASPLKRGVPANAILNGHKVTFVNKTGINLLVIDLGHSYSINTVLLHFIKPIPGKISLYVIPQKPGPGQSWSSIIANLQPNYVLDAKDNFVSLGASVAGEYLVFAFQGTPAEFYDLYVTAIPDRFGTWPSQQPPDSPLGETPRVVPASP
jgi:hypothetical protein